MLAFNDGNLIEVATGAEAVQALIDSLPGRTELNCIALNTYLLARRNSSSAQVAQLDAIVIQKLARAAKAEAQPAKTWYQKRASNINRNWLNGFATSPDVPETVRQAATL